MASTDEFTLSSESYAVTSADVDLGAQPGDWFPSGRLATVRLAVEPTGDQPVFVGIGPSDEVETYREGVAVSEVSMSEQMAPLSIATSPARPGQRCRMSKSSG